MKIKDFQLMCSKIFSILLIKSNVTYVFTYTVLAIQKPPQTLERLC